MPWAVGVVVVELDGRLGAIVTGDGEYGALVGDLVGGRIVPWAVGVVVVELDGRLGAIVTGDGEYGALVGE